jgi:hypothetical protein
VTVRSITIDMWSQAVRSRRLPPAKGPYTGLAHWTSVFREIVRPIRQRTRCRTVPTWPNGQFSFDD